MSIFDVFILTIFISFCGIFNVNGTGTTRNVEVPRLKVPTAFKRWYTLLTNAKLNGSSCTNSMKQQLGDQYTLNVSLIYSPKIKIDNPNQSNESEATSVDMEFQNYTSIILDTISDGRQGFLQHFEYNLVYYLMIYTINDPIQIENGTIGQMYIFNRQKTLANGLVDELKQSDIEEYGLGRYFDMYIINTSSCE